MSKRRLDDALVLRGLAPSRSRARDSIMRGCVSVDGSRDSRPGRPVSDEARIAVSDPGLAWVSRAALKLEAALDAFDIDPRGAACLDIGASTGGFTQVLLSRGARRVAAVDVGHGQLAPVLAADPRVSSIEGLNARYVSRRHVAEPVDLIVTDVSFISLRLVLPPALALAGPGASLVALVKPQFELGPEAIGKGGIVRDPAAGEAVAQDTARWIAGSGWTPIGVIASPIVGRDGNREYLLGAGRD